MNKSCGIELLVGKKKAELSTYFGSRPTSPQLTRIEQETEREVVNGDMETSRITTLPWKLIKIFGENWLGGFKVFVPIVSLLFWDKEGGNLQIAINYSWFEVSRTFMLQTTKQTTKAEMLEMVPAGDEEPGKQCWRCSHAVARLHLRSRRRRRLRHVALLLPPCQVAWQQHSTVLDILLSRRKYGFGSDTCGHIISARFCTQVGSISLIDW